MDIEAFQTLMRTLYFAADQERGIHRTALWLGEEIGELMHEVKQPIALIDLEAVKEELADVIAWSASLANILNISLADALQSKYPGICSKCKKSPCECQLP